MVERRQDQETRDRIDEIRDALISKLSHELSFFRRVVFGLVALVTVGCGIVAAVLILYLVQIGHQQDQRRRSLTVSCEARNYQNQAIRRLVPPGVQIPREIRVMDCQAYAKRYAP